MTFRMPCVTYDSLEPNSPEMFPGAGQVHKTVDVQLLGKSRSLERKKTHQKTPTTNPVDSAAHTSHDPYEDIDSFPGRTALGSQPMVGEIF